MITGNVNKIDLSTSSFKHIREKGYLFVDKTKFIEHFLMEPNTVQVLLRQRRFGKSLNMNMLKCFLTDTENNAEFFKDLYIGNSEVWGEINSSPVLFFDFKNLSESSYKSQILTQAVNYIKKYIGIENLDWFNKIRLDNYISDRGESGTDIILFLTELIYEKTKKKSYILIDEYDKLLTHLFNNEKYEEIRTYETEVMSAALKDNEYLEKALLTGVMHVTKESILDGFNNIAIYDLFSDNVYQEDFGLTDNEVTLLSEAASFDKSEV